MPTSRYLDKYKLKNLIIKNNVIIISYYSYRLTKTMKHEHKMYLIANRHSRIPRQILSFLRIVNLK